MLMYDEDIRAHVISADGHYRYILTEEWNRSKPQLVCILTNPSKADAIVRDNTDRCVTRLAKRSGYGGKVMLNLFAWRSTSPTQIYKVSDPVGKENDTYIHDVCGGAQDVLCGWGPVGDYMGRASAIMKLLAGMPHLKLFHLGLTKGGFPRHPLYISNEAKLIEWKAQS